MLPPFLLCKATNAFFFDGFITFSKKYYTEANSYFIVQTSYAVTADIKDISSFFNIIDHFLRHNISGVEMRTK